MSEEWDATDSLLSDRPETESEIRELLEIDAQQGTWAFNDVDIDSGIFGELVNRGIVEKTNGGYQVTDPDAVQAALEGESVSQDATKNPVIDISALLPPRQAILPFVGALGLVFLFRLLAFPSVFRGEDVVLLGNDPYFYRHILFEFLEQGSSITNLSSGGLVGEPLMLSTLLAVTQLFGGNANAAELVLAWYPVAAALITAAITYSITMHLTENRRIALAAVVILAVTPAHAVRTAIGFADHHAFDYVWLGVTALSAVTIVNQNPSDEITWVPDRPTMVWTGVLSVGVAAQVLAWNAGPLLLLPLAFYGVLRALTAISQDSSVRSEYPLVVGIGFGGILAVLVHFVLGWQHLYIVSTPLILAAGLATVFVLGEASQRRQLSPTVFTGGVIISGGVVLALAFFVIPEFGVEFIQEINRLVFGYDENISEASSIFSPAYGTVAGPFFFFGLSLFFTLWYLGRSFYVTWSEEQPDWLLIGSYTTVLFVLALFQVRFAGELAMFAAIYAGLGLVDLAAIAGAGTRPTFGGNSVEADQPSKPKSEALIRVPGRKTVFTIGVIFLLIGGLGAVMSPVRMNTVAVDDDTYNAAVWMESYSEEQGWEYPENYVLSSWSDNRVYNAFVSNESRSYSYAEDTYESFISSSEDGKWADKLDSRAGFIVVDSNSPYGPFSKDSVHHRLNEEWGSNTSHYRLLWATSDGEKKVFTLVKGAQVTGNSEPSTRVVARTQTTVNDGTVNHTYATQVNESGTYTVRIPQPGTYTIQNTTVTISEEDVTQGRTVRVSSN